MSVVLNRDLVTRYIGTAERTVRALREIQGTRNIKGSELPIKTRLWARELFDLALPAAKSRSGDPNIIPTVASLTAKSLVSHLFRKAQIPFSTEDLPALLEQYSEAINSLATQKQELSNEELARYQQLERLFAHLGALGNHTRYCQWSYGSGPSQWSYTP